MDLGSESSLFLNSQYEKDAKICEKYLKTYMLTDMKTYVKIY